MVLLLATVAQPLPDNICPQIPLFISFSVALLTPL